MNVTLAGLAYEYGANIHALNLTRAVLFWLCLLAIIQYQRLSLVVSNKTFAACIVLGVLLGAEMYVLLGAILFIPVALAIVIMYTYPLMIALYDWGSGRAPFSYLQLLLMVAIFSGLYMALSVTTGVVDITGVALAFTAAAILATLLILSERTLKHHHNSVIMFYMLSTTCIGVIALCLTIAPLHWPLGTIGWLAFWASSGAYVLATFLLFTAVHIIGPLRTAIIDNTAPVWAVLFGFALLGQVLSALQTVGVVTVVAGVLLIQWTRPSTAHQATP